MTLIDLLLEQIIEMLATDPRAFVVFAVAVMTIGCVASWKIGSMRYGRLKRYRLLLEEHPNDETIQNKKEHERTLVGVYWVVTPVVCLAITVVLLVGIWR